MKNKKTILSYKSDDLIQRCQKTLDLKENKLEFYQIIKEFLPHLKTDKITSIDVSYEGSSDYLDFITTEFSFQSNVSEEQRKKVIKNYHEFSNFLEECGTTFLAPSGIEQNEGGGGSFSINILNHSISYDSYFNRSSAYDDGFIDIGEEITETA